MPCRDGCVTAKGELVKVLEFTHFYEHFTFDKTDWSDRGKHLKKYIRVILTFWGMARNTETELWCQITSVLQEYIQMTDFRKCVYAFLDLKPLEDEKVYTDD